MWLCLLPVAALAQDPDPVSLSAAKGFFAEASALVVDERPIWVSDPLPLHNGPLKATLTSGYVVPVHSGGPDGPWVGFVWVDGAADVALRFPEPADALRFGMRMVGDGADPEALRALVRGEEPLRTTASEGLVLGATQDVAGVLAAYRQERERLAEDVDLVVEVVGERRPAAAALRDARALLERRLALFRELDVDVGELVALDRMRRELYGSDRDGAFVLAELHTAMDFPLDLEEERDLEDTSRRRGGARRIDRLTTPWVTSLRDDTGAWSVRDRVTTLALVPHDPEGVVLERLATLPFPPRDPADSLSAPGPSAGVVAESADVTVKVRPSSAVSVRLDAEVDAQLVLRANGSVSVFRMTVPRGDTRNLVPVDIRVQTDDGVDVLLDPPFERYETVVVALPGTYADGEEVRLRVRVEAHWPYGDPTMVAEGRLVATGEAATVGQAFVPGPAASDPGRPTRLVTRVGTRLDDRFDVAVSGDTVRDWTDGAWAWTEASSGERPAAFASIAVGRWATRTDAPYEDLPGVRVHVFSKAPAGLATFAPEIRRQTLFLAGFLPPFPVRELDVVQIPGGVDGVAWVAPFGTAVLQQLLVEDDGTGRGDGGARKAAPHLEHAMLAHEVAHQYWGHLARAASGRDQWIPETFAEGYACMYVAAAFDPQDCRVRMRDKRRHWEEELAWSGARAPLVTAADSTFRNAIVYQYGPYVMFEMLQRRIGTAPYFAALDGLLRDRPDQSLSTEALQAYFEATSGTDLDDFFQFWVYGGYVPSVTATWWTEADGALQRAVGVIEADVPFGTFDLPVRAYTSDGTYADAWVVVTDGRGELRSAAVRDVDKVELDPDGLTLLRKRKVRRGAPPSER